MSTSEPRREPTVCNTTPVRYFAVVGHFDLLVEIFDGRVNVPREVLDPDEEPDGIAPLLSEIGQTERHFATRSSDIEGWSRIRALWQRTDIEVVDLSAEEIVLFAELRSRQFTKEMGLAGALGPGEAAVIAIAVIRGWAAVLDDAAARAALSQRSPETEVWTSRELLRSAAVQGHLTSEAAESIYLEMREKGYRGPDSLWGS